MSGFEAALIGEAGLAAEIESAANIRGLETAALTMIVLLALCVLTFAGWKLLCRIREEGKLPQPGDELFSELARTHRLNPRQRKLLLDAARRTGLADPAALFVRKSLLLEGLQGEPERDALVEHLFGTTHIRPEE